MSYYYQPPRYRSYQVSMDQSSLDLIDKIHNSAKPMAIPLIAAGVIGLLGRPPFKFQDKGIFHIIYKGSSAASIAIGLWAMFT